MYTSVKAEQLNAAVLFTSKNKKQRVNFEGYIFLTSLNNKSFLVSTDGLSIIVIPIEGHVTETVAIPTSLIERLKMKSGPVAVAQEGSVVKLIAPNASVQEEVEHQPALPNVWQFFKEEKPEAPCSIKYEILSRFVKAASLLRGKKQTGTCLAIRQQGNNSPALICLDDDGAREMFGAVMPYRFPQEVDVFANISMEM